MKKTVALLTVGLLTAAGVARADGPDVIEMRQTAFDLMSGDFAGIKLALASKAELKTLEYPGMAIQRYAALLPTLFPKGSDTGHNTKALPEIWSDNAGFQKNAATLGEAAGKFVVAVKANDADGAAAGFKAMGEACGACHRGYRAK